MNTIEISSITGLTPPYEIFACNVFEQNCVSLGVILSSVPPTVTFTLPPQFTFAPAVGIKIVSLSGECSTFNVEYC